MKRTRQQLDQAGYGADTEDDEPGDQAAAPRPAPYPIEEAMECALAASDPIDQPPHPRSDLSGKADILITETAHWLDEPGATIPDAATAKPATDTATAETAATADATAKPLTSVLGGQSLLGDSALSRASAEVLTLEEAVAPLQPWKRRFVMALHRVGGVPALAAREVNVSSSTAYKHRGEDAEFATLWDDACRDASQLIEGSLYVSAVHGNLQPIYQGGILAGYKRVKDTKAAEILLRAYDPARFAPEQVVRIKGDAKVTVVDQREVPAIVGQVIAALFAARSEQLASRQSPVIDV